jgi:hypothetical protein
MLERWVADLGSPPGSLGQKFPFKGWAPVAHAYNLSYSGDRDQEDRSLKPAWANSSRDLVFRIPTTKIGLTKWLKVKALSSSPRTSKKKKSFYFRVGGRGSVLQPGKH